MSEVLDDFITIDEENRRFAVKTRGCNILLAAAAGSGKTTTLVNRIVERLIYDENTVDIDKLLVVTFTKDAAAELRLRIDKELGSVFAKALEDGNKSLAEKAYRQKLMLPKATIGTIDSFCLEVVQKNFIAAGIDPSFRIDDNEASIIIETSMDAVLEKWYAEKDSEKYRYLRDIVDIFCDIGSDNELKNALLKRIYGFAVNFESPRVFLERTAENYHGAFEKKGKDSIWYQYISNNIFETCSEIISYIDSILEAIRGDSEDKRYAVFSDIEPFEKVFCSDRDNFVALCDYLEKDDSALFSNDIFVDFIDFRIKKTIKDENKIIYEALRSYREEYKNYYLKVRKLLIPGIEEKKTYQELSPEQRENLFYQGIQAVGRYIEVLCNLIDEIVEESEERMRRRKVFNFNGISRLAYDILKNDDIACFYKDKYEEIYIDEYQDTSVIQEGILTRISRLDEGIQNIFMVGDVKQSIYGFRNATPEFFVNKYNLYKNEPEKGALRILSRNFRSRKPVLDAVNEVFSAIMRKGVCEIAYTQDEFLNYGAKKLYEENPLAKFDDGKAELWISKTIAKNDDLEGPGASLRYTYGDESLFIIDKIISLFEDGFTVYDKDLGKMRGIRFSDIAIISRDNKDVRNITGALRAYKIPVSVLSEEYLFDRQEVISVLDFMRVIDNPYQDYPIVSLLKSEFFGFDDNELACIRTVDQRHENFYASLLSICKKETSATEMQFISSELKTKVQNFIRDITLFREIAVAENVSKLTWLIINHNGFYDKNSSEGKGNLRLLLEKTYPYDKGNASGLYSFILFVDSLLEIKKAEFSAYAEDNGESDKIKVMTIHKSKGLEFPVVFVLNAGKLIIDERRERNERKVFLDSEFGVGFSFLRGGEDNELRFEEKSASMCALKHKKKKTIFSESQRLLYVAMTRAREKLYVTATVSAKDFQRMTEEDHRILSNISVRSTNSFVDLIALAVAAGKSESCWNIFKTGKSHLRLCDGAGERRMEQIRSRINQTSERNSDDIVAGKTEEIILDYRRDENFLKALQTLFESMDGGSLPAKLSVSAVKKMLFEEDSEFTLLPRDQLRLKTLDYETSEGISPGENQTPLSAAEFGTLMHKCFQYLIKERHSWPCEAEREVCDSYVEKFIKSLTEKKILTEAEYKEVNKSFLSTFISSDRAKEIAGAVFANAEVPFTYLMNIDEMLSASEKDKLNLSENLKEKNVAVQGIIDLYYQVEKDKIVLLDFKTDRVNETNIDDLKEKYAVQLRCYGKALEKITGYKVEDCVLLFVRNGKEFIYDHNEKVWRN